ncbi:MAG: glycosyltransferase family 4 protein, partial [Actinobacteria bacterium]|nr:glycosyltransferase family 4 protein [Actinomycetota bacterium]
MRILHISWEYPPLLYGGLGRHVHALAEHQAANGNDVTVLTQRPLGATDAETVNGVHVIRVDPPSSEVPRIPEALIEWTHALDERLAAATPAAIAAATPDVAHAHDWVVSAAAAAAGTQLPLVTTVHATEGGRHGGWVNIPLSQTIHNAEFVLTNRSDRVIACSRAMRSEIHQLFGIAPERIDVIPNGIDLTDWTPGEGGYGQPPTVVFTGRLEWEKGVHVLLSAVRLLLSANEAPLVLIAGTGTREHILKAEFADLIESGTVRFLGWVSEHELRELVRTATVAVVPSIYEPFG